MEAAKHIKAIAVPQGKGFFIPWHDNPGEEPIFYMANCHDPSGTSKLFYRLYELTGKDSYLEDIKSLYYGLRHINAPEQMSPGCWNTVCVCCGTAGILQFLINLGIIFDGSAFATEVSQEAVTAAEILSGEQEMIEIVTDEHYSLIRSLFEESTDSIRIISPFLSRKMADLLCNAARNGLKCSFITRFYLQDFLDGSNSLDGLEDMLDSGVKLYALIGLHTKLYLFDSNDAIVGSANFTEGGLVKNIELSLHLNNEQSIVTLQEYYDEITLKIENNTDGIITKAMLEDFKNRYALHKDSSSSLRGGTRLTTAMRGAALDRRAKNILDSAAFDEIESNRDERLHDAVYAALGGEKKEASHKALRNIILKFSASSRERANGNEPMRLQAVIDEGKSVYISNFSEARKSSAKTVEEGDETFFCVHSYDKNGNTCPIIVGKGYFRKFSSSNDARTKDWKYEWINEYPIYCVVSEAKIIDAPINCGIPLREMVDTLGYKAYEHTRKDPDKYPVEKVAKVHGQQAMLALTMEAKEYLDQRLEALGKEYGWTNYNSEV